MEVCISHRWYAVQKPPGTESGPGWACERGGGASEANIPAPRPPLVRRPPGAADILQELLLTHCGPHLEELSLKLLEPDSSLGCECSKRRCTPLVVNLLHPSPQAPGRLRAALWTAAGLFPCTHTIYLALAGVSPEGSSGGCSLGGAGWPSSLYTGEESNMSGVLGAGARAEEGKNSGGAWSCLRAAGTCCFGLWTLSLRTGGWGPRDGLVHSLHCTDEETEAQRQEVLLRVTVQT